MHKNEINTNQTMYSFIKEAINGENLEKVNYFGNKINAEQMFQEIDKIAHFLQKRVAVGESVAICLPNIPQAIFCFYAINKIGAVANIIHPKIKTTALIKILEKTNCKWIFIFDRFLRLHSRELQEHGIMSIGCSASFYMKNYAKMSAVMERHLYPKNAIKYAEILKEQDEEIVEARIGGNHTAVLLHSSGTTGDPKTVMLSSYAFNELAANVFELVQSKAEVKKTDGMLMILPMFHGFGLGICVHLMMYFGRAILLPVFKEKNVIKLLKQEKVEMISGVPSMFRRLGNYKKFGGEYLSNLKLIFCGGDKLESAVKNKFESILQKYGSDTKIMEGYGLSETASVVTINVDGKDDGSLGVPLPNVQIKIENGNTECKANEIGEIVISSPSMMKGYLEGVSPFYYDKMGKRWIKTGDIGYKNEEGKLFYKGREKRLLKVGGVNIFPQEVERIVEEMPEISYVCAIRIIYENKPALKLLVVTRDGKLSANLKNRIINRIKEELLPYAVPKIIERTDKMVLSVMGKVDYKHYEKLEEELQGKDKQ